MARNSGAHPPDRIRGHRPRFEPTPTQRKQVEAMAGHGVPQADIALVIGVSKTTLTARMGDELARGAAAANAKVAKTLFEMATSGDNTSASIFWAKARLKWSERSEVDVHVSGNLSTLTDKQLSDIAAAGRKRTAHAEDGEE